MKVIDSIITTFVAICGIVTLSCLTIAAPIASLGAMFASIKWVVSLLNGGL